MNILDLQLQGYYKTYLPMQHISVEHTGEIMLNPLPINSTLSFSIYSNLDRESEINIFCNDLLVDSAKIYKQPLYISLNIPSGSSIKINHVIAQNDYMSIHDIMIDEATEIFHSSLNTHSTRTPLPIKTKTNAFIFVVDQNFLNFLQLFLLTLRRHNTLENTSLIGLIPENDIIAKKFLIENNINIIEYNKTFNLRTAKQIIYMDSAHLCTSDYLCLIDLDMIILGDIEAPFNILKSLTPDSVLMCHEQGIPSNTKLHNAFNNECLIYPMNADFSYIEQFVQDMKNSPVINNGLTYASRKSLMQFSNYLRTYSTYFRKWIQANENNCAWSEQGIFNIASCAINQLVFLNPSFNVQANTQQEHIIKENEIYKYKNEIIKILHLNGNERNKYHEYLNFCITKYGWNIFENTKYEQIEKLLPEYFDQEISYDCMEEFKDKKILCYTNKMDLLYRIIDQDIDIITTDSLIHAIHSNYGKHSKIILDLLSYINTQDISEYDILVINNPMDQYHLRTIVDLIRTKKITIPVYCKIHYSIRINKMLPNLQEHNVKIIHLITNTNQMYEYYFIKIEAYE